jgi:hypothetical protein
MVWSRILGLLAIAAALAGCEPKPDTFRVFGLDWIAAQQARAQRKDAALVLEIQVQREILAETASLARLSQDLSLDLDFEYEKASSSAKWMAVAAALAWTGDDDGAAHAATVKRQHSLGARAKQMPVPFACDCFLFGH